VLGEAHYLAVAEQWTMTGRIELSCCSPSLVINTKVGVKNLGPSQKRDSASRGKVAPFSLLPLAVTFCLVSLLATTRQSNLLQPKQNGIHLQTSKSWGVT
jgi:hypothetical protein